MRSSRCARRAAALGAAMSWLAGLSGAGAAESPCGASQTVQSGDTLASIAARCETTVEALIEANAQIVDPARISVGWELAIPGGRALLGPDAEVRPRELSEAAEAALAAGSYEVRTGDSFASIATALQLSLRELIAANEGIDPFGLRPGQIIRLPEGAGHARAGNEGEALNETNEHSAGSAAAPDEADGESARAALSDAGPDGEEAGAEPKARESPERLTLRGRVQSGTECAVLETPDGDVYSLVSAEYGLLPGEYVEIEGETVESSLCIDGKATVRVTSLTTVPAPRGG